MHISVQSLKKDSHDLWNAVSANFPELERTYTDEQQIRKELDVDQLMQEVDGTMNSLPRRARHIGKKGCLDVRSRIQRAIVQLLHSFDCVIDEPMETRFSGITDEFIRQAYEFDPGISDEAVYQASRNVLIMNTFQIYLGRQVILTPSVFAYSMLYPYTDNYLDSIDVDTGMKKNANERLLLRLSGQSVPVQNHRERIVDRLVCMIETEFDRNLFPQVFESLLAIHRAQISSLVQSDVDEPSPDDLLDISIEKGGTSVLADGYLVGGDLNNADAEFLFRFGVLLQLIDDLQDLVDDRIHGQRTLAGKLAGEQSLDTFTNRLISYLDSVVGPLPINQSEEREKLRLLIERSCRLLIFEAIASNRNWYHDEYLAKIQRHSPVRFDYLRSVQKRMRNRYTSHPATGGDSGSYTRNDRLMKVVEFMR